jgi:hypothetical protein
VTTTGLPHCAALARQLGERPTGTASRHKAVLLIEHPGTWPGEVREQVLTAAFGPGGPARLDELHIRSGLRALVIRRPGRHSAPTQLSVFAGRMEPGHRWLEKITVTDLAQLADLDLEAIATGAGGFGVPVEHPLLLVCVHGRKDACCAIRGRPVADALAISYPEQAWQCTHFGGDRWAGNLLVAPHGFMYGQLEPETAVPAAKAAQRGEIALSNLRGRTGISSFAQVAEIAIRERTGLLGLDEVQAGQVRLDPAEDDGRAAVEVHAAGLAYRVIVARRPLGVQGHSVCSGETHPHRFEVLSVQAGLHR